MIFQNNGGNVANSRTQLQQLAEQTPPVVRPSPERACSPLVPAAAVARPPAAVVAPAATRASDTRSEMAAAPCDVSTDPEPPSDPVNSSDHVVSSGHVVCPTSVDVRAPETTTAPMSSSDAETQVVVVSPASVTSDVLAPSLTTSPAPSDPMVSPSSADTPPPVATPARETAAPAASQISMSPAPAAATTSEASMAPVCSPTSLMSLAAEAAMAPVSSPASADTTASVATAGPETAAPTVYLTSSASPAAEAAVAPVSSPASADTTASVATPGPETAAPTVYLTSSASLAAEAVAIPVVCPSSPAPQATEVAVTPVACPDPATPASPVASAAPVSTRSPEGCTVRTVSRTATAARGTTAARIAAACETATVARAAAAAAAASPSATEAPPARGLSVQPSSLQQKLAAAVPLMVVMRGLPGSGKTTLACHIAGRRGLVVSADDYFVDADGRYRFRPGQLNEAHEACQLAARRALRARRSLVVVDNTNTELWELKPYAELAVEHDYHLEVVEPTTSWRSEPRLLARRCVHHVPLDTIERMLHRYRGSDVVNVVALYRMIGVPPKPWPPAPVRETTTGGEAADSRPEAVAVSHPEAVAVSHPEAVGAPALTACQDWAATCAAASRRVWRQDAPARSGEAPPPPAANACAETQTGGPTQGRVVCPRVRGVAPAAPTADERPAAPPLRPQLHRATMTSPQQTSAGRRLAELRVLFPAADEADLCHVLSQCDGDVNWATNLLLDSNLVAAGAPSPPPPAFGARDDSDSEPDVIVESETDSASEQEAAQSATSLASAQPCLAGPAAADSRPPVQPAPLAAALQSRLATLQLTDTDAAVPGTCPPPAAAVTSPPTGPSGSPPAGAAAAACSGVSSCSSPTPSDSSDDGLLSLQLPAQLVFQLQELFGPAAFGPRTMSQLDALPASELTVSLPLELARSLHAAWLASSGRAFAAEQRSFEQLREQVTECCRREEAGRQETRRTMMQRDEEMARQLQAEEDGQARPQLGTAAAAAPNPVPQLREIMDMEQALQRSEQTSGRTQTQAERLTQQRLRAEFPGVDPRFLDELLEMHDGEYQQVVRVLQSTRGERPLRTPAIRAPSPAAEDRADEPLAFQGGSLPSFEDLHAESEVYRQMMRHAETMAARAVRLNWGGVSQYYVEERDRLARLLGECNMRAAVTSVDLRHGSDSNQLDLHELMVDQALTVLASFIADRQRHFGRRGVRQKTVEVITGRGKNSKNGKPKIKPAVMAWLSNKGIRHDVAPFNAGMLLVTVDSEHLYRPLLEGRP